MPRLRVPSGVTTRKNGLPLRTWATTSSTNRPGLARFTGMPPRARISPPNGGLNRVCLPSHFGANPYRQQMASMNAKSQFEVCGAPISTADPLAGGGSERSR